MSTTDCTVLTGTQELHSTVHHIETPAAVPYIQATTQISSVTGVTAFITRQQGQYAEQEWRHHKYKYNMKPFIYFQFFMPHSSLKIFDTGNDMHISL